MLLLGKLMTFSMNSTSRKGKEKKRMGHYLASDHRRVCRTAFCILHDISVKKLKNLKAHLQKNGFSSVIHGNCGEKSHRGYSLEVIKNVVVFIKNFGEIHGLPQQGYSEDDLAILRCIYLHFGQKQPSTNATVILACQERHVLV